MTNEEAIKELKKFVELKTSLRPAFLDVAINALEKQIPKKPQKRRNEYFCSNCHIEGEYAACVGKNHHDGHKTRHEFCFKCGQLQDWSDDNV